MDLEATCENGLFDLRTHGIIEIGIVLLDIMNGDIIDKFHTYVQHTLKKHKRLSEFCKRLTHITQYQISNVSSFDRALRMIEEWVNKHRNILQPPPSSLTYPLTTSLAKVEGKIPDFPPWPVPRNFVWATHRLAGFEWFLCAKSRAFKKTQLPPCMLGGYINVMQLYNKHYGYWLTFTVGISDSRLLNSMLKIIGKKLEGKLNVE